jgi:hypothetical protein
MKAGGRGKTAKSKIIYIPDYEDCLIQRKELWDFNGKPEWEYFSSFSEARRHMISYWQNVMSNAMVNLRTARGIKKSDCV